MKESTRIRIAEYKAKLKKHAPEIISVTLGVAGAIGWSLAGRYKRELEKSRRTDPFTTFMIPEPLLEKMKEGAILKYRCVKTDDGYAEEYTLDEFEEGDK